MSRSFSREEFYELVWSSPMTHLAKEFVLSDVALHKICRKHNIPTPPQGWWAKKAAGKKVIRAALPKMKDADSRAITIASGELRQEPQSIATARENARVLASEAAPGNPAPASAFADRTIAKLEKAKPDEKGIISALGDAVIRCDVSKNAIDRLKVVLPRVIQAASLQGFKLEAGKGGASFARDGETIGFAITEGVKRVKHVLTDAEQAKYDEWDAKRQKAIKRNDWDSTFMWNQPRFADWDYHPTGILAIEFEQVYVWPGTSPRRSFRDTKNRALESIASDIGVGLAVLATSKTEQRLKREAEQRRVEEDRKRREELARQRFIEDRRVKKLASVLENIEEIDRLRRLINLLTLEAGENDQSRVSTFLEWVSEYVNRRQAGLNRAALERDFAEDKIFGDADGDGFIPRGW